MKKATAKDTKKKDANANRRWLVKMSGAVVGGGLFMNGTYFDFGYRTREVKVSESGHQFRQLCVSVFSSPKEAKKAIANERRLLVAERKTYFADRKKVIELGLEERYSPAIIQTMLDNLNDLAKTPPSKLKFELVEIKDWEKFSQDLARK